MMMTKGHSAIATIVDIIMMILPWAPKPSFLGVITPIYFGCLKPSFFFFCLGPRAFNMITTTNHYHEPLSPPCSSCYFRGAGWSTTTERDRDRGGQTQGDGKTHLKPILIVLHFFTFKTDGVLEFIRLWCNITKLLITRLLDPFVECDNKRNWRLLQLATTRR